MLYARDSERVIRLRAFFHFFPFCSSQFIIKMWFKSYLLPWFIVNFPKVLLIFVIGFTTRFLINYYLGVNVFVDYMNLISIVYYFNFSWIIVYINSIDLNINRFKLIINRGNITYHSILWDIRCIIEGFISSNNRNKITMYWEGFSPLDNPSNIHASPMNNNGQVGVQGNTPALIKGSPDIKPNGRYDTPPMVYVPGGNNQPYGRILSKALEDCAIRSHHIDNKGNASTMQLLNGTFEADADRFISDFFSDRYPNRVQNQRWNSAPIRRELYNL